MARIFITGSTEGLGKAAALARLDDGHEVVLHARNASRAASLENLADRAFEVVTGDLGSAQGTHDVTGQVNAIGRMDAVIHNAGVYIDPERVATPEGHARTLAVNVLAPYVLAAEIERPARLIYISSGMHRGGDASLRDIDWTTRQWNGIQATRTANSSSLRSHSLSRVGGPTCSAASSIRDGCPPGWAGPTHRTT
jgi:NAD(P)-dependent dehydrogenase (short-subunit alcohol dehydrogenase family)